MTNIVSETDAKLESEHSEVVYPKLLVRVLRIFLKCDSDHVSLLLKKV